MEQWKPVLGYEGIYEVSDAGRVRRIARYRSKPGIVGGFASRGYVRYLLSDKQRHRKTFGHVLVMEAFHGPAPDQLQINHKNGHKQDNRLANLEYVTCAQNQRHKFDVLGVTMNRGSKHGMHKLTESTVLEIIQRCAVGDPLSEIAVHYRVSVPTVSMIAMNRTWKHLPRVAQRDRRIT